MKHFIPVGVRRVGLALLVPALLAVACDTVPAARSEATEACTQRGLQPGTAAFAACVAEVEDAIYVRWGRNTWDKGD